MSDVTTRLNIIKGKTDGINSVDLLNKEFTDLRKNLNTADQTSNSVFNNMSKDTNQARSNFDNTVQSAERLTKTYREQREAVGDLSTGLGALGSVSSAVGGQGIAEGLRLGGDVAGALEYLPNLGDAVKTIGIEALTSSGTIGYMATAALTAIPALGGVGAGLVAISIAALPFVGIGIGLAVIFGELNKQAEQAKISTKFVLDATFAKLDADEQVAELIKQKNIPALKELASANNTEIENNNKRIAVLNEMMKVQGADVEQLKEKRKELETDNNARLQAFAVYSNALNSETVKTIETADSTKLLTDELTKQNTEANSLKTTIDGLTQQENDLVSSQEQRREYQAEDLRLKVQETAVLSALQSVYSARKTALDSLYASEDAKATQDTQNAELSKRLLDIQTSATAKIADLQNELVSKQVASNEQLSDVETQSQAQAVKRLSDFEAKKKAIEDKFQNAKFEAGVNNDVTALALAQRERKQGKRGASKEFNQAEKEANQASQTRIAQIRTELESFTVAQNEKIKVETDSIATAQANEIKSFNDNEKREALAEATRKKRAESYARLEEQLANQRSQLATYYDNIRAQTLKQREDEALNAQLQKIDVKKQAELSALDAVIVKANELKALMDGKTVVSPKPGGPTPSKVTAFAEGGIVTKPMMGLVGERGSEAIIPLRKLSAFASGSSKKSTVINTQGMFNGANFGEVLTPNDRKGIYKEVERALRQFAEELLTQTE